MLSKAIDVAALAIVACAALFATKVFVARSSEAAHDGSEALVRISPELMAAAATGHSIGDADAPVTILVFWDYGCSFCREYDEPLRRIIDRYPDHVRVVIKQFVPLTYTAYTRFALGVECAAQQGAFIRYHTVAMRNPHLHGAWNGWRTVADSASVPDPAQFNHCVESAAPAAILSRDYEQGVNLGVTATPTSFVNGELLEGAIDFTLLDSVVASQFPRREQHR